MKHALYSNSLGICFVRKYNVIILYMYMFQYLKEVSNWHGGMREAMNKNGLRNSLSVMKTPTTSSNTITKMLTSIISNFNSKHAYIHVHVHTLIVNTLIKNLM